MRCSTSPLDPGSSALACAWRAASGPGAPARDRCAAARSKELALGGALDVCVCESPMTTTTATAATAPRTSSRPRDMADRLAVSVDRRRDRLSLRYEAREQLLVQRRPSRFPLVRRGLQA